MVIRFCLQLDLAEVLFGRSVSKYPVSVGEHEPDPIDGHNDYDGRKDEFCKTILRHRTNSENKAAERIMIARRLRHAGSGWGQYPVQLRLPYWRCAATKLAR
jgi:hypothetical protein